MSDRGEHLVLGLPGTPDSGLAQGSLLNDSLGYNSEERKKRLARERARRCTAQRRATESAEERERRLRQERERVARARHNESEEKREQRLRQARESTARRRAMESEEEKGRRRKEQRERVALRRLMETPEQRAVRLKKLRERRGRVSEGRAISSPEQEVALGLGLGLGGRGLGEGGSFEISGISRFEGQRSEFNPVPPEHRPLPPPTQDHTPSPDMPTRQRRVTRQRKQLHSQTGSATPTTVNTSIPFKEGATPIPFSNNVPFSDSATPIPFKADTTQFNDNPTLAPFKDATPTIQYSAVADLNEPDVILHKLPLFRPDDGLVTFESGSKESEKETNSDSTPTSPQQVPVGRGSRDEGATTVIGGTGLLQRRYDHPDFTSDYTVGLQQKLGHGVHAIVTKGILT